MTTRLKIIDCTLREGCQTIQCSFDQEQTTLLAKKIAEFGVDMIECGHPKASEFEAKRVVAAVRASPVPVLSHARCRLEDVDAVLKTGAPWIGLFASFNEISLNSKFKGLTKEDVARLFDSSIRYAKNKGLYVRATIEDGGRTSLSDLVSLFGIAYRAGADRVCFADSVGMLMPSETYDVLSLLRQEFPNLEMEYHGHNDQGLALANTLEAIRAGVTWLSTSCNGIGERAGITDTFQLGTVLYTRFGYTNYQLKHAHKLSELVETFSRIYRSPMQPIVGQNVFSHAAKLHQIAVCEDSLSYNIFNPQLMGREVSLEKHPPMYRQNLFLQPFEKSSTELKYHRHGPGKRFVMLDHRLLPASPYYFIARKVEEIEQYEPGHVDSHRHNCDSVFLFLGDGMDYTGLTAEVIVMNQKRIVNSPATVFIPAGALHTYRFIAGRGTFINFVNKGEFSQSLMEITNEAI